MVHLGLHGEQVLWDGYIGIVPHRIGVVCELLAVLVKASLEHLVVIIGVELLQTNELTEQRSFILKIWLVYLLQSKGGS